MVGDWVRFVLLLDVGVGYKVGIGYELSTWKVFVKENRLVTKKETKVEQRSSCLIGARTVYLVDYHGSRLLDTNMRECD